MKDFPAIIFEGLSEKSSYQSLHIAIKSIRDSLHEKAFVSRDELDIISHILIDRLDLVGSGIEVLNGRIRPTATAHFEINSRGKKITELWKAEMTDGKISIRLQFHNRNSSYFQHFRSMEKLAILISETHFEGTLTFLGIGLSKMGCNIFELEKFITSQIGYSPSISFEK